MSQAFSSLNSWGAGNVAFFCFENTTIDEGSVVSLPIPTFNRAHDLGPFTGNGLQITHDFSTLVGNVSLGNINVVLANIVTSPNVSITNTGNLTWRIGNIKGPEDYLAANAYIDFPPDVGGQTIPYLTTIRNVTSNVSFVINGTITITDLPEWIIPDPPYPTGNLQQSLWPMVYANNASTNFDDNFQTAYVGDLENPAAGPYTVTIDTQDYPSRFTLSSNTTTGLSTLWSFAPATEYGRLTLTGSRGNVNTALANLSVTTNSGYVTNAHPTQRTVARVRRSESVNGGAVYTDAGGLIGTGSSPFVSGGSAYYFDINGPEQYLGANPQGVFPRPFNFTGINGFLAARTLASIQSGSNLPTADSTWAAAITLLQTSNDFTHEFWMKADSIYNTNIFAGSGLSITIYNNRLWAQLGTDVPNQYGQSTPPTSFPRRIEHTTNLVANTWYHVALVRQSGQLTLYLNGVANNVYYSSGTTTTTKAATAGWTLNGNSIATTAVYGGNGFSLVQIGGATQIFNYRVASFKGWMDEIRISDIARYTGNFTPPASAFINDKNTFVLLNFRNGIVDDYALPDLGSNIRNMTWSLTNPTGLVSTLTQEYTPPREAIVSIGNAATSRLGSVAIQHVDLLYNNANVPFVQATAPYTITGYDKDLISVAGNTASKIQLYESPWPGSQTANAIWSYSLARYVTRDARVTLPNVGAISNAVGNVVPGLEPFKFTVDSVPDTGIYTQGGNLLTFHTPYFTTPPQNFFYYVYDTLIASSDTAIQTDVVTVGVPGSYRDSRIAWRWLQHGSEFSNRNQVSVRVESIQLHNNAGGWTRTGGFYGDWSSLNGWNPNNPYAAEFSFGCRVFAVGALSIPNINVLSWQFSPLTNRSGLGDYRAFNWVTNDGTWYGLFAGGEYTVGSQGFFTATSTAYPSFTNKPFQIDIATFNMADMATTKYATVTFTIALANLSDNTIPVPGGGYTSPVKSYTKTVNMLYGRFNA